MIPRRFFRFVIVAASLASFAAACGGAKGSLKGASVAADDEGDAITAEDLAPRALLASAELTTAVDEERYLASAPTRTEFAPEEPQIYLVGKLQHVPTRARIEVRWFRDADPRPMLVSETEGSDTFSFVASLRPLGPVFVPGPYTARIFVDGREVGGAPFRVLGAAPADEGPKASGLAISAAVGPRMRPKGASREFASGARRLFATFRVDGAQEGSTATVRWLRNGAAFQEQEVEVAPEGRFGAQLEAPDGLPDGSYTVAVRLDAGEEISAGFTVGDPAGGPRVDRLEFGRALGDDNLPEAEVSAFSRSDDAVRCGLRFLDLPAGSEITVQWFAVAEGGGPILMHTTKSSVPGGGSGTMGAEWPQPDGGFEPGAYKVVVAVAGETLAEGGFTVE